MANKGKSGTKLTQAARKSRQKSKLQSAAAKAGLGPLRDVKDLDSLLRFALADPTKHANLLATAEAAYLRIARGLRKQALRLPVSARADLEQRSNSQYFRAVVARNLPKLFAQPPRRAPVAPPLAPVTILPLPGIPQNVRAVAAPGAATVLWDGLPDLELIQSYRVTPYIGTVAQPALTTGVATLAVFSALNPGSTYTFAVSAVNSTGTGQPGVSNAIAPAALLGTGNFTPTLPTLSSETVLLLDPLAAPALPLLQAATSTAETWRYEYLKQLATNAASSALQFETHISELMQLAMMKATAAEQLLNPMLINALQSAASIKSQIAELGSSDSIDSLLPSLADIAAQSLLLPRLIEFLATTSPIDFWVGLFEAMISDLASAIFSSTSFSRTRKFLDDAFGNNLGGIQDGVKAAAAQALQDLDAQIDAMAAPLRSAVSQVVAGTSQAMAEVFESFDLPVLLNTATTSAATDIPDVDPFLQLQAQLGSDIDQITQQIRSAIHDRLNGLLGGGDSTLFITIVVTYLVLPILALLVISLAGGPFSAALLAAAVLLAAEELVHLLLSWLSGPLLNQVGQLQQELGDIVKKVQQLFARTSNLVLAESPQESLDILANELRVLRDLAPQAYLDDTAALLRDARDAVLQGARDLAGAAEQAAGLELGTAFEVIQDLYDSDLPSAPLLPGGADAGRFASAALLRDLGRLEQQRTALQDGKDLEITHRLSLARVLGSGAAGSFSDFLANREAVLHLDDTQLTDMMFPGMYRVLLKDLSVTGIFANAPSLLASAGIPLSITHLGTSSTRIKRRANGNAPPLELPDFIRLPNLPVNTDPAEFFKTTVLFPAIDSAMSTAVEAVFQELPLVNAEYYFLLVIFIALGWAADGVGPRYRDALLAFPPGVATAMYASSLPDVVAAAVESVMTVPTAAAGQPIRSGHSFVDLDQVRAVVKSVVLQANWSMVLQDFVADANTPLESPNLPPTLERNKAAADMILILKSGAVLPSGQVTAPGLESAVGGVFDDAVAAYRKRIARWGNASLVEDPDPQVRALGYARLVREAPAEASLFNLLPGSSITSQLQAQTISNAAEPSPLGALSGLQYRPFENRGLDSQLLIRLESLPDGLAQLGDALPSQLSDLLSDVLLEVTVRGCYDPALAAVLRASRRQQSGMLAMAGAAAASLRSVVLPGTAQSTTTGVSELRTVHLSMRAHRDRSLQAWATATQLGTLSTIPGLLNGSVSGIALAPLSRDAAFVPLVAPTATSPFNFSFSFNKNAFVTTTESALIALAGNLQLDPSSLGLGSLLSPQAGLVGMGIGVIPMPAGTRAEGTLASSADPIGVSWKVDGLLGPLLDAAPTTALTPLPTRLVMTTTAPSAPVGLDVLFNASAPPAITVSIPAAAFPSAATSTTAQIYDVILSLSFRVPLLQASTAIATVR